MASAHCSSVAYSIFSSPHVYLRATDLRKIFVVSWIEISFIQHSPVMSWLLERILKITDLCFGIRAYEISDVFIYPTKFLGYIQTQINCFMPPVTCVSAFSETLWFLGLAFRRTFLELVGLEKLLRWCHIFSTCIRDSQRIWNAMFFFPHDSWKSWSTFMHWLFSLQ